MISAIPISYINLTKKGGMASFNALTNKQLRLLVKDFVNTLEIPEFKFSEVVKFFKRYYPEESFDGHKGLAGILTYLLKMGEGLSRENPRKLFNIPPTVVMFVVEVLNRMTNGEIHLEVVFEDNLFYITKKDILPLIGVINHDQSADDLQKVLLKAFRSPETFSLQEKLRALWRNREEVPAVEAPAEEVPAEEVPVEEIPAVEVPAVEVPAVEAPTVETPAPAAEPVKVPVQEESRSQSIEDLFARIRDLEYKNDSLNIVLDKIEKVVEQGLKLPGNNPEVIGCFYAISAMCS